MVYVTDLFYIIYELGWRPLKPSRWDLYIWGMIRIACVDVHLVQILRLELTMNQTRPGRQHYSRGPTTLSILLITLALSISLSITDSESMNKDSFYIL